MVEKLDGLILLPRLRVENANLISGPLTWGFPAPSAFTGFVHALQRRVGTESGVLDGVGIVCHQFDPQVYRAKGGYRHRFRLARHPVERDGGTASIVEEGRAHMEVTLLVGMRGDFAEPREGEVFAHHVYQTALSMRLAGGSVRAGISGKERKPVYLELGGTKEGDARSFRRLCRQTLPGFALVDRHQMLCEHWHEMRAQRPSSTALEALLDLVQLRWEPEVDPTQQSEMAVWRASRARQGWLVPLPKGYGAISRVYAPGEVRNTRDTTTPFRFVESLYSLGEWLSPHRLERPQEVLWYHHAVPDSGLYLCETPSTTTREVEK